MKLGGQPFEIWAATSLNIQGDFVVLVPAEELRKKKENLSRKIHLWIFRPQA